MILSMVHRLRNSSKHCSSKEMRELELLAPARNADIGIAAIDCGADAVYIAGPKFGARQSAGNPISEIARLCRYAHQFGCRIFVTLNTIIYDDETASVADMLKDIRGAGADAVIVQDMATVEILKEMKQSGDEYGIPLHASTQCAIRTPEKAKELESSGFTRLVLERELSLELIREIASSVKCEIEFFVHGALCVCYSGQCYLSENIAGRSANRGACIQACRSRYDLVNAGGRTIIKDKAILSLKDFNLKDRLGDLAEAGVMSFKIEGRLKNISYVRNTVRAYSEALDRFVEQSGGKYGRASFGSVSGGFRPDLSKTFNRGYTGLFIDGKRGKWASMDTAKSMGEEIGTVTRLNREHTVFTVSPSKPGIRLGNGDGLAFVAKNGDVEGVRADVCKGMEIHCKSVRSIFEGARLFRNYDIDFERQMESRPCVRRIKAGISVTFLNKRPSDLVMKVSAQAEDGKKTEKTYQGLWNEEACNIERMKSMIVSQLSKTSGIYSFSVISIHDEGSIPLIASSALNSVRNDLGTLLAGQESRVTGLMQSSAAICTENQKFPIGEPAGYLDYKYNIANGLARRFYSENGYSIQEQAYELTHRPGAELMRTKYCIRYEIGLCPRTNAKAGKAEPLFLINNGRRLKAVFHCRECEMTIVSDGEVSPGKPLSKEAAAGEE